MMRSIKSIFLTAVIDLIKLVAGGFIAHTTITHENASVQTATLILLVGLGAFEMLAPPLFQEMKTTKVRKNNDDESDSNVEVIYVFPSLLGEVKRYERTSNLEAIFRKVTIDNRDALKAAYRALAAEKEENELDKSFQSADLDSSIDVDDDTNNDPDTDTDGSRKLVKSSTATAYENIALEYFQMRNFGKAKKYFTKALDAKETVVGIGKKHPSYATTYISVGTVWYESGNYDKALKCYYQSLETIEKVYGEDHVITASIYDDLGAAYYRKEKYGKALKYCKKALRIYEISFGKDHRFTATSYENMGAVYHRKGDLAKKQSSVKDTGSVSSKSNASPSKHADTSAADLQQALKYYYRALTSYMLVYGRGHSCTAECYKHIGALYARTDYKKALKYYNDAFEIHKLVYGEDHIETQNTSKVYEECKERNKPQRRKR